MKNTGKREKNPELNRGGRMVALILAFLVVLAILPQVRQERQRQRLCVRQAARE